MAGTFHMWHDVMQVFITIINIYWRPLLGQMSPNATRKEREEVHIVQIPFITMWQSQITHRRPVSNYVLGLLSPCPLRACLGLWGLEACSLGWKKTCSTYRNGQGKIPFRKVIVPLHDGAQALTCHRLADTPLEQCMMSLSGHVLELWNPSHAV